MARNTLARIDSRALTHNLNVLREMCPDSAIMALVKADAYGHRLEFCLQALEGADLLGVATLEEAREVRQLGSHRPVLLLEGLVRARALEEAAELGLELVVHEPGQVEALEQYPEFRPERLWLKIDTGMHRLGFPLEQARALLARLEALEGVREVVVMTHFACADQPEHPLTVLQMQRFDAELGQTPNPRSLANSAGILHWPESHRDWVRAGILLYGISPLAAGHGGDFGLQPVMTLESELISIIQVRAGESIGYGARFVADRDMKVGIAAIGYGDGYPRSAADGTPVLVAGRRTRLVGRVSMDMIAVDVTELPDSAVGDTVTLWGRGLPVEEVARHAGTIAYELVCRVTRRVRFKSMEPSSDGR